MPSVFLPPLPTGKAIGMVLLLLALMVGCSTTRTPEDVAAEHAKVVGVWEYRTDGTGALQRGTLRVFVEEGRLKGRLQDSWRGQVDALIQIRGSRMELRLDRVRISGRLRENRFEGVVQHNNWDVTSSGPHHSTSGRFVARRVQNSSGESSEDFGCPSLLRESSYICSPFRAP
jgi:hypothetical protein